MLSVYWLTSVRATFFLRSCNQSCTDSGLHTHFSLPLSRSLFIHGYAFRRATATGLCVQNVGAYLFMSAIDCGDICAPVSSTPLRGPAKLSRVLPSSRAHPRHPGRCLDGRAAACLVWILFVSPPKQTGHGARALAELKSLIDEIIMRRPRWPFNPPRGKILKLQ